MLFFTKPSQYFCKLSSALFISKHLFLIQLLYLKWRSHLSLLVICFQRLQPVNAIRLYLQAFFSLLAVQPSIYLWLIWQIANNMLCIAKLVTVAVDPLKAEKEENISCCHSFSPSRRKTWPIFSHVIILHMRTPHITLWQWPHHYSKGDQFQALFFDVSFGLSIIIFSVMLSGFLHHKVLPKSALVCCLSTLKRLSVLLFFTLEKTPVALPVVSSFKGTSSPSCWSKMKTLGWYHTCLKSLLWQTLASRFSRTLVTALKTQGNILNQLFGLLQLDINIPS